MKKISTLLLLTFFTLATDAQSFVTRFETSKGAETPTYDEIVAWWQKLDAASEKVRMIPMGPTDSGYPLHLILVSNDGETNLEAIRAGKKTTILINNGIHPGEPDGIDASMLLVRDIVTGDYKIPDHIQLAFIPVYNIGGCLNRSANYRVDQNGPEEFGFRGNARNFDLNRDFIKNDSRNAQSFTEIFHALQPDVFVDNHVSNGADYQHVMTLLTTQHSKLGGVMGEYLNKVFEPALYAGMKKKGFDLIPYVNSFGDSPDNGWPEFWDSPRYGSGYGALWNCFSFVPEAHMLKPYDQRVKATYALMQTFIEFTGKNSAQIEQTRQQAMRATAQQKSFPLTWKNDRSRSQEFLYRGYEAGRKPSEVSGLPRLYYDRKKPYDKKIPLFNFYEPVRMVEAPEAYIIPQGWWPIIERLQRNKIIMREFESDTTVTVEVYRIEEYKSGARPYEGHHTNTGVKLSKQKQTFKFRKGDWYIPMNQAGNRFLIETLEPEAEDSYFTWNFFDPILGQKEGYSAYAFEDIAAEYLKSNRELQVKLEEKRKTDSSFAASARDQLNFIYQNSPWFEPDYLRYPVYRVVR
jgi:hypothetical protein